MFDVGGLITLMYVRDIERFIDRELHRSPELLLGGFGGLRLHAQGFAALNNAVQNLVGFVLQVVFVNEAVKTFDFRALAELFGRRGQRVALHEVDR